MKVSPGALNSNVKLRGDLSSVATETRSGDLEILLTAVADFMRTVSVASA